jgi:hypothetical protein
MDEKLNKILEEEIEVIILSVLTDPNRISLNKELFKEKVNNYFKEYNSKEYGSLLDK